MHAQNVRRREHTFQTTKENIVTMLVLTVINSRNILLKRSYDHFIKGHTNMKFKHSRSNDLSHLLDL